jgi:hypothetical protein
MGKRCDELGKSKIQLAKINQQVRHLCGAAATRAFWDALASDPAVLKKALKTVLAFPSVRNQLFDACGCKTMSPKYLKLMQED